MMKIVKKEIVEIDEKELARDLSDFLFEALSYQLEYNDAEDIAYRDGDGDYEIQRLAMLDKVGQLWHEDFLKKTIDTNNKTTLEKED